MGSIATAETSPGPWNFRAVLIAAGVWVVWIACMVAPRFFASDSLSHSQQLAASQACGAIALVMLLWVTHPTPAGVGSPFTPQALKTLGPAVAMVLLTYLAVFAYTALAGVPPEPYMSDIRQTTGLVNLTLVLGTALFLAPIGEEIFYRHFLLKAFPVERSRWWATTAVLFSSLTFSATHTQYQNGSTVLGLFAVGCVCGWARLRSGDLRVAILLHSLAGASALLLNLFR